MSRGITRRVYAINSTMHTVQTVGTSGGGTGAVPKHLTPIMAETDVMLYTVQQLLLLLGILTCTFRTSCYSTRLSWAHTPVIRWLVVSSNPVRGLPLGL